jgi:hypothetical protein
LKVDTINLFFQCKIRKWTGPTSTWEVTVKTSWKKCWQQHTKFDFSVEKCSTDVMHEWDPL